MLIKCMLPLSIVEREGFKEFINYIDPSFVMPTRKTIKDSGIPNLKDVVHSKIKKLLETIEFPSMSVDGWSDATMRSFNGYICQGVDENWDLQTFSVDFKPVTGIFMQSLFLD